MDRGNGDNSYNGGDGGNAIQNFTNTKFVYYTGFDSNRLGVLFIAIGK